MGGEEQMNRKVVSRLLALSLSASLVAGSAFAQNEPPVEEPTSVEASEFQANLMASLGAHAELSDFAQLLTDAGMDARLNDGESYTLFVPNNTALEALNNSVDMTAFGEFELQSLAHALIVSGAITPDILTQMESIETLGGTSFTVSASGDAVEVDGVTVNIADAIVTDNGVIYVVSEVFGQVADLTASLPLNPAEEAAESEAE